MEALDRLTSERLFHDRQALDRQEQLAHQSLRFTEKDYLDHETWIRPAFESLGNVAGLRVLDLGCGHGMASVVLARRGAEVVSCDLSGGYLSEAHRRARANGVSINFLQADAHHLPFREDAFDRIWGHAILHHLDLKVMARELWRILRPGGRAVFCEPWGENPLLDLARTHLPYPGKERTPDEKPLRRADLNHLRTTFPTLRVEGFQLLAMVRRVLPSRGSLLTGLEWCDQTLMHWVPGLGRFCRYVVITLEVPGETTQTNRAWK